MNNTARIINKLARQAHTNSKSKGFWDWYKLNQDDPDAVLRYKLSAIALMHSELSEAVEGIRKDLPDDHLPSRSMEVCELADTVIRILDYAGAFKLPLGDVILEKMAYNERRPHMHGGKKA